MATTSYADKRKAARRRAIHREAVRLYDACGIPKSVTRCRLRDEDVRARSRGTALKNLLESRNERISRIPSHTAGMREIIIHELGTMAKAIQMQQAAERLQGLLKRYKRTALFDPFDAESFALWRASTLRSLRWHRRKCRMVFKPSNAQLRAEISMELGIIFVTESGPHVLAGVLHSSMRREKHRAAAKERAAVKIRRLRPDWQDPDPDYLMDLRNCVPAASIPGYEDMHPVLRKKLITTNQVVLEASARRCAQKLIDPLDESGQPITFDKVWVRDTISSLKSHRAEIKHQGTETIDALLLLHTVELVLLYLPKVPMPLLPFWLELPGPNLPDPELEKVPEEQLVRWIDRP